MRSGELDVISLDISIFMDFAEALVGRCCVSYAFPAPMAEADIARVATRNNGSLRIIMGLPFLDEHERVPRCSIRIREPGLAALALETPIGSNLFRRTRHGAKR